MKIVFWNILFGFHDMSSVRFGKVKLNCIRRDLARDVLVDLDPDIVVLTEAQWYKKEDNTPYMNYAAFFNEIGLGHCTFVNEHHEWAYAVGSKDPCYRSHKLSVPYGEAGAGRFFFQNQELVIDTFHPHPTALNETQKFLCFKEILKDNDAFDHYIIGGDFNTTRVAPPQWGYNPTVIPYLEQVGLKDLVAPYNGELTTFPTKMDPEQPKVSLDHVFGKGVKVVQSRIVQVEECNEVSDHYPIFVEIEKC